MVLLCKLQPNLSENLYWLSISNCNVNQTHNHLLRQRKLNHLAKQAFLNDWAMLWELICTVHLIVCYYHVKYAYHVLPTLYSCLNVKELLARNRRDIWSLHSGNTGKLGWSSICLKIFQFEPEIMLGGMLNFKTHFMVWYCVWDEHCNGLF